jgi:hypothetical protein
LASENSEISAYALVVITNFVAFHRNCSDALAGHENNFFAVALGILATGPSIAKVEAAHFVCTFLQSRPELADRADRKVIALLIEALDLEDRDVSRDILELFLGLALRSRQFVELLLELGFDEYLLNARNRFAIGAKVGERLYALLSAERKTISNG